MSGEDPLAHIPQQERQALTMTYEKKHQEFLAAGRRPVVVKEILENIAKVGEGGYGEVYKAMDRRGDRGDVVAVKKLRRNNEREGFPITSVREIKLLRELDHENIVKIRDILVSAESQNIYVLFEYMEHDLSGLMSKHNLLQPHHVKCLVRQLFLGIEYLHGRGIMHRDVKPSNVLISNNGVLKLCDFGFARDIRKVERRAYTPIVVTLWYRAPEVLLGSEDYGPPIDMWSVGCILVEMLNDGTVLFPGKDELDQLDQIFQMCGTPTPETCPGLEKWRVWASLEPRQKHPRDLSKHCRGWQSEAVELLNLLLDYDTTRRVTASTAIKHPYFFSPPAAATRDELPKVPDCHKYQDKHKPPAQQQAGGRSQAAPPHGRTEGDSRHPTEGERHGAAPTSGPAGAAPPPAPFLQPQQGAWKPPPKKGYRPTRVGRVAAPAAPAPRRPMPGSRPREPPPDSWTTKRPRQ